MLASKHVAYERVRRHNFLGATPHMLAQAIDSPFINAYLACMENLEIRQQTVVGSSEADDARVAELSAAIKDVRKLLEDREGDLIFQEAVRFNKSL